MFIQTEATADPARLKFLPGRQVLVDGTCDLRDKAEAAASPLAERIFAVPGVEAVSFAKDSITVTKAGGDWQHLKPMILGAIMEHFMSGAPVLRGAPDTRSMVAGGGRTEAVEAIWEALRRVLDPELGYNIVDLGLVYDVAIQDSGVVLITMTTTTPGCPATNYLRQGACDAVSGQPGIASVNVALTYDPRWTPEMMRPDAKAHFGIVDGDGR